MYIKQNAIVDNISYLASTRNIFFFNKGIHIYLFIKEQKSNNKVPLQEIGKFWNVDK